LRRRGQFPAFGEDWGKRNPGTKKKKPQEIGEPLLGEMCGETAEKLGIQASWNMVEKKEKAVNRKRGKIEQGKKPLSDRRAMEGKMRSKKKTQGGKEEPFEGTA